MGNVTVQLQKERYKPWFCFSFPGAEIKIETPWGAGTGKLRG